MPRRYRGMDIFWWLEQIGALDRTIDEMRSTAEARREPSLQLVGRTSGGDVDLATLAASGVTLTGRLTSVDGTTRGFADDLDSTHRPAPTAGSTRLLDRIDGHIAANGARRRSPSPRTASCPTPSIDAPPRLEPATPRSVDGDLGDRPPAQLSVAARPGAGSPTARSTTATASRAVPGLYVLGQRFQRTRRSNFLDGVGADAVAVTRHLLARQRSRLQTAA